MPSGRFLMEDFYYAGGIPAVIRELEGLGLINRDALTANGKTIWENTKTAFKDRNFLLLFFTDMILKRIEVWKSTSQQFVSTPD